MPSTIYLHWAATGYGWVRSWLYHSIISGDGWVQRLHSYAVDLPAHTGLHNSQAAQHRRGCTQMRLHGRQRWQGVEVGALSRSPSSG